MPRKRNNPPVLESAFTGRWPVAAALCAISFVGGFVIIPGVLGSNALYRPMASMLRMMALLPVIGFGCLAVFKYLRERRLVPLMKSEERMNYPARDVLALGRGRPATALADVIDLARPEASQCVADRKPDAWSLGVLQSIEWKRFEAVVAAYFRAKNFRCETQEYGPDGGVDGRLYFRDASVAVGVVQCKAWSDKQVGVAQVRELLGVMAHEKVSRGYFCATGDFSSEARAFAAANPIKLISGKDFLDAIARMPSDARQHLLEISTSGDYTTPTCASCGIKLVERTIGRKAAWGCRNYPRCKTKIFRKTRPV